MDWVWNLWRENAPLTLAAILVLAGFGIPSPASITIIATGALIRNNGAGLVPTILLAVAGSTLGSFGSYLIAKKGLGRWLEKKRRKPAWKKAVARFERDAFTTIFLSRWLLTPLGLAVSYLAGGSKYPIPKYLAASALGSTLWVLIYGGIGYAFANQWQMAAEKAKEYGVWIFAAAALLGIAYFVVARRRNPEGVAA